MRRLAEIEANLRKVSPGLGWRDTSIRTERRRLRDEIYGPVKTRWRSAE